MFLCWQNLGSIIVLFLLFSGCARVRSLQTSIDSYRKYSVLTGPEDFVLDTFSGINPRLIVSCGIKRRGDTTKGGFMFIDLANHQVVKADILLSPDFPLFPHGIDILKKEDSVLLYAVNHQPATRRNAKDTLHSVLKFLLKGDSLFLIKKINSPLFKNPNAVCAFEDGNFLVTNMTSGSYLGNGNICFCTGSHCQKALPRLFFANGITRNKEHVFAASTLKNKIYCYQLQEGKLQLVRQIRNVYGGDNLRIVGDTLYVAAHVNVLKFLKHAGNAHRHSPSAVYAIPLKTWQPQLVFFDDGKIIDASSTALRYRGKYYITGVFDPEVVEILLKE
jgi:hypothetical protein